MKKHFSEAFKMADDVHQGICGITDLIITPE